MSDNEGRFQVAGLTAGTYRVMAALAGFETTTQSVVVTHEGAAVITVDLPIARFADTIDVVGETTAVSNGRTLAPVEVIASRELDEFAPGQGFQGAIRMLSTAIAGVGRRQHQGRPAGPGRRAAGDDDARRSGVGRRAGATAGRRDRVGDRAAESICGRVRPVLVGTRSSSSRAAPGISGSSARTVSAPSLRSRSGGGFRIDSFNPRMEVGGPLVKDRVYVEQSVQARYSIGDLAGAARNRAACDEGPQLLHAAWTRTSRREHFVVGDDRDVSERGRLRQPSAPLRRRRPR